MTTLITDEPAGSILLPTYDQSTERRLAPRPSLTDTVQQTLAMAWRALKKMRRNPEQFFDVTLQPVLFTAMFTFILGGGLAGSIEDYLPWIIPGVLAQSALTACMAAGTQMREDMDKGVFDRFKAMPIARIAPLAGPMLADLLRYGIAATITVATGMLMGYRPGGGFVFVVLGLLLTIFSGWCLSWIFACLGTVARSAQAVQGIGMMVMFPLTFLSNAMVDPRTMPDWLETFVNINPVSHVVTAVRDLMNDGQVTAEVGWAVLGCTLVVAIFAPLAVRFYSRKM